MVEEHSFRIIDSGALHLLVIAIPLLSFRRASVVAVTRDSCAVRGCCLLNAGRESSDAVSRFLTAVVKPRTGRGRSWVSASLMVVAQSGGPQLYRIVCATCVSGFVGEGPVSCDALMMH